MPRKNSWKGLSFRDQAQAILDMQLRRLQGLERKIQNGYEELLKKIAYYAELLADEQSSWEL